MIVAVTGATGHVGANLIRELVAQEVPVRALIYKDQRGLEGLPVERVAGDVLHPESLERAFRGADTVFHLAAHVAVTGRERQHVSLVNVQGTRNVVQACLENGVRRLVHVSSTHACCQEPYDRPIDETRPLADTKECLDYDRSKALGEREVMAGVAQGLNAVVACPSGILGPYDYKPSHMGATLLAFYRGLLPALVEGGYDWVDVRDVCRSLLALQTKGEAGARFLLTGHWLSVTELSRLIEKVTGRKTPRLVVPRWLAMAVAPLAERLVQLCGKRPLFTREALAILGGNSTFDSSKATAELGHRARPPEETIQAAYDWFRRHGMI